MNTDILGFKDKEINDPVLSWKNVQWITQTYTYPKT